MLDTVQQALNALSDTRFTTYWLDSLDPIADEAALEQDTSCDLLVVGGGFCLGNLADEGLCEFWHTVGFL